jgi:multiple sugar transport system substrate-binding protein
VAARRTRRTLASTLALAVALGLAACDSDAGPDPDPDPTSAAPVKKEKLDFGVWGTENEIASYQVMVDAFNETSETSHVTIQPYADRAALEAAVEGGGKDAPEVFLANRDDLTWLREGELNVPVDELLDERGVEFGDQYSRAALEAFSVDRRLQCMPYAISPRVMFYNTALVDFERMTNRGLDAPVVEEDSNPRWSFDQMAEAARFASRPRRNTKGVYVEPSARALAPFLFSGGGQLFDDDDQPTSFAFSDESSREALMRTLELLRDPTVTLSDEQLAKRSALEWFERGKLGILEGDRSMVPALRQIPGLQFDVMPMPVLDSAATVGEITGACIAGGPSTPAAADFLVYALSTDAVSLVTRAGYLVPVNQEVALTVDFQQAGRQPAHAEVFTSSVRDLQVLPLLDVWPALDAAIEPILDEMFTIPVLEDLESYTTRLDEASQPILAPPEEDDSSDESDAPEEE